MWTTTSRSSATPSSTATRGSGPQSEVEHATNLQNIGPTDLDIDVNGTSHVAYQDWGFGDLRYAHRVGGNWEDEVVAWDPGDRYAQYISIGADTDGATHIAYYDIANGDLEYATNASGTWDLQTLDENGDTGLWPSLQVDSLGFVHVAYHDETSGDLRYATDAGGAWTAETAAGGEGGTQSERSMALRLDGGGAVHIIYRDVTNSELRHCTNASGFWESEIVDDDGDGGSGAALTIDDRDDLHAAYFAPRLRYAHLSAANGVDEDCDGSIR